MRKYDSQDARTLIILTLKRGVSNVSDTSEERINNGSLEKGRQWSATNGNCLRSIIRIVHQEDFARCYEWK